MCETDHLSLEDLATYIGALNSLSRRELDLLKRGDGKLRVEPKSEIEQKPGVNTNLEDLAKKMARELDEAGSREDAERLLASISQPRRKAFLNLLAKSSGIHVMSTDTIADIKHKLIEGVVGSKLQSKAFRTVPF